MLHEIIPYYCFLNDVRRVLYLTWPRHGNKPVSLDRGLEEEEVVHYAVDHCSGTTEEEIPPFATPWMDLENIMLREISPVEKVKDHVISLIFGT